MSRQSLQMTPALHQYLVAHGTPPDDVQRDLMNETGLMAEASMQIAPEQGAFLTVLTKLVNAKFAVEVGTFTGYSSISIARGLTEGGRLLCCDVSEEWTDIARRYWDRAGVTDRIDLKIAPALDTLRALPMERTIDFSFIDADKTGYSEYWEEIVTRTRPGGVIVVDNVLQNGRVIDPQSDSPSVQAIREFNTRVRVDDRVDIAMIPVADGLTIAFRH
ncbi:MAG: SAM-dependent methyltransferase [Corynebacteriales bacterium]|nr:SAM-dependent methyltransferase [Mycobacteriales bacterium]